MRNGFKIWDTDTHTRPSLETLEPFYSDALRARLPELEQYKRVQTRDVEGMVPGRHSYSFPDDARFERTLGQEEYQRSRPERTYAGRRWASYRAIDDDPEARIRDMDEEGVDVQLMVGSGPNPGAMQDPDLQIGFMQAYGRYLDSYCSTHPHRLKALLPLAIRSIDASVAEIKRWGKSSWMVGVYPNMANDTPLDHPRMEPIWQACDELGLAVVHHSHYNGPPYFPGYKDVWDNAFLARSASHPWGAMRAIGSFIGSGIMERYQNIRFGILECGCGWLPFWMRRLDDQAEYVGGVPKLQHQISEYMTGGRFFSAIEMSEGEDMIQMVIDFMGPDVLMYGSDYPHMECRFPGSTDYFLKWDLSDQTRRRLLWENPVRLCGEP